MFEFSSTATGKEHSRLQGSALVGWLTENQDKEMGGCFGNDIKEINKHWRWEQSDGDQQGITKQEREKWEEYCRGGEGEGAWEASKRLGTVKTGGFGRSSTMSKGTAGSPKKRGASEQLTEDL